MRKIYRGLYRNTVEDEGAYWCLLAHWTDPDMSEWRYGIAQYPFVPGYNVIDYGEDHEFLFEDGGNERVISNHKTLAEAGAILRLLATDPSAVTRDGA